MSADPGAATHEVTNQPPALEGYDVFADDTVLVEAVEREGAGWAAEALSDLGRRAGSAEAIEWGTVANANPPQLKTHDRFGHRIDEVTYHPYYHRLMEVATRLGPAMRGVMTHGGHSYAGRSTADMEAVAEQERAAAVGAAERLRTAGHAVGIVSVGSSPTALHARHLQGVTEVRAGVYMFGDLFQASIGTHAQEDIAVTVLAAVIGLRPAEHRLLVDAGGLALSKDRSTQPTTDLGFGLLLDALGRPAYGRSVVVQAYQEHGVIALDPALPFPDLHIGSLVRIAPNHVCMTAATHDRYWVVDASDTVVAEWPRVNGW